MFVRRAAASGGRPGRGSANAWRRLKDRAESEGRSAVADIGDRAVFRFAEESEGRSAVP
ncbi:hypothetical protein B4135_2127 [Caldibacillus debilis]|uniref:Uncharacterized protein n=1 Tax=Caldibacillus debilis TaxID=301148 RepID=A0A150M3W7_9BACI|nr:hypothetical protein B4135_2127 [Caldibacillus debilis]